mmetsp:Transcript_6404/g.10091  ORF Transcript_6404/g.10091 Transcript_6404/m.10091 type:complete len:883 (-) Transcript_6404:1378-4026(-)
MDENVESLHSWFRSADMEYISIVLQEHAAHKVISRLGRLGVLQFTDLNAEQTLFQRRYVNDVQRCDAVERKLKYLEEQLEKFKVSAVESPNVDAFLDRLDRRQNTDGEGITREQSNYMDNLEMHVDEKESELVQLNRYNATLSAEYNSQVELQQVLDKARNYAADSGLTGIHQATSVPIGSDMETGGAAAVTDAASHLRFRFISGVVNSEDRNRFERMVFRSTRGNCLMQFYDTDETTVDDLSPGDAVKKEVFIIFFQAQVIESKIKRICEAFGARLYQIPDIGDIVAINEKSSEVHNDINDRRRVLEKNRADIVVLLSEVGQYLEVWKWIAMREKSIYHTMNHFASDVSGVLRAEGWVVSTQKHEVTHVVGQVHAEMMGANSSQSLPSSVTTLPQNQWPTMPPTFFKVNKFTRVFQVIVDTYGVPRYQEANPALLTVITFPFAFGIMFGDIGHGALLFLGALFIVLNELKFSKMKGEMVEMLYNGRYMLLLMGLFATYGGLIYNDFFAMGLRLWQTCWVESPGEGETIYFNPDGDKVYPIGIDPTWHRATNDLLFMNSLKMKMAVIFGVTQMTVGLVMRVLNALYFHKGSIWTNLDLWFEAVPMVVFMMSLFGYMCFVIIYKWSMPWGGVCNSIYAGDESHNCAAPGLITTLINIALKPGTVEHKDQLYSGQATVQVILLLIAVIQVPLMLIPKPYILIKRLNNQHKSGAVGHGPRRYSRNDSTEELITRDRALDDEQMGAHGDESEEDHDEHGAGDIAIHQAIETIEFTLGCVSNTASYLRLWALSLAHSQLASVFLEKALLDQITGTGFSGILMTFVGYAIFAAISFAVLMMMDNLECFLHALRLHWVEYQNKFYGGDGLAFTPLSFRTVLETGSISAN